MKAKTTKNPHGAGREVKEKEKAKFLEIYEECGTVTLATNKAGISRMSITNWRRNDPAFKEKFDAIKPLAKENYVEVLEAEAHRRAVVGVDEPVYYRGELVGQVRKFSDQLLTVLLNANAPEKYHYRQEVTGKDGGPVLMEIDARAKLISLFVNGAARVGNQEAGVKAVGEGGAGNPLRLDSVGSSESAPPSG